jgi:hypothetical protein
VDDSEVSKLKKYRINTLGVCLRKRKYCSTGFCQKGKENEMARVIVLTSCEETVTYPQ